MRRLVSTFAAVLLGLSTAGSAAARPLEATDVSGQKVRIDGLLREWPKNFDRLSENVRGNSGGDPTARGVVCYDADNIYVAMEVKDAKFVRTGQFGKNEDHAELLLAFPTGRAFKTYRVQIFAGKPGKSAGAVKLAGGGAIKGAKIVEAATEGGHIVEAQIPWTAFREASRLRAGMRASLQYHDADAPGAVKNVVATSATEAVSALPALLTEGEVGLYETVTQKNLPEKPAHMDVGDIAGDKQQEVVAIYGPFLTVVGGGYRGGKEFFFQDMGIGSASNVKRFEVRDLTGDGKDDILLVKRVGSAEVYREIVQVLSVSAGTEAPSPAFEHEIAVVNKDLRIENEIDVSQKGGKVLLIIEQGENKNVDPGTYEEPLPGNMESALMPWDSVKSRAFSFDGSKFTQADETPWEPKVESPGKMRRASSAPGPSPAVDSAPSPPPPRPPSAEEMLDRLYALYRKDRGVGKGKPRFDFVTDVAGDGAMERVLVHGKDIVAFGKNFKAGQSYVYITVGVDSPDDVLDATARDLTGDGKAEIVVRGVLHAKASEQLGGHVVDRHALYIYQVTEGGVRRVFAAETGRSLGDNSILAGLRFLPEGRSTSLELRPGRAIGWNKDNYPFPVDREPYGGLEPLLVPWGDQGTRQYKFDGSAFVKR